MTWPTAVATDAQLLIAVNNIDTLLTAGIDAAVTTIPVTATAAFPAVGFVTINAETIFYTSKDATNFLGATRGADGTAADAHSLNDLVSHFNVAAHHNVIKDEVQLVETDLFNAISVDLDDSVNPIAVAATIKARFDHFATQIKNLSGKADWKTAPITDIESLDTDVGQNSTDIALRVLKGGDSMSGALAMGANKITGLAAGVDAGDALRFEQRGLISQLLLVGNTTPVSTTSTSFVDDNLSLAITLKSTSSRVRITISVCARNTTDTQNVFYSINRDAVNLGDGVNGFGRITHTDGNDIGVISYMWIDSPASTSELVYKPRFRVDGGTGTFGITGKKVMTVEEILV